MKVSSLILPNYQTNCFIIETEKKNAIIIDPGSNSDMILSHLKDNGLTLKTVLLTHGHYDHVAALFDLKKEYDVVVYASKFEEDFLTDEKIFFLSRLPMCEFSPIDFVRLNDYDKVKLDELTLTFVHTPGHSKGSGVYLLEDMMFAGDTLFSLDCGRCDLHGGDYLTMLNSLTKLAELDGNYKVFPGHGEFSDLDRERRANPYMQKDNYDDII